MNFAREKMKCAVLCVVVGGILLVLFLGSCATSRPYDANIPVVSMSRAQESDLSKYGATFTENPFKEPNIVFIGKLYEFYIVKISLNFEQKAKIRIEATAKAPAEASTPVPYNQADFIHFWDVVSNQGGPNPAQHEKRKRIIEDTVIPDFEFTQKAGQATYYLVFVGKRPIKRPISYEVLVVLENGESFVFSETVD
jgi:hypothetical protein